MDVLPQELVFQILEWIPAMRDQAECALVSRSWAHLMAPHLYRDIAIFGPQMFSRFMASMTHANEQVSSETAKRRLYISRLALWDANASVAQLSQLANLCPNLTHLSIDGRVTTDNDEDDDIEAENDKSRRVFPLCAWPRLAVAHIYALHLAPRTTILTPMPQLTQLTVYFVESCEKFDHVLQCISNAPALEHLTLSGSSHIALDRFRRIHAVAPALRHLALIDFTLKMPDNDDTLSLPPFRTQYRCMETLEFTKVELVAANEDDWQAPQDVWFEYIASSYPCLRAFHWRPNKASPHMNLEIAIQRRLLDMSPQLSAITLERLVIHEAILHERLLDRSNVVHVGLSDSSIMLGAAKYVRHLDLSIAMPSTPLPGRDVVPDIFMAAMINLFPRPHAFPYADLPVHLVSLSLESNITGLGDHKTLYNMDMLLDRCPQLQTLCFINGSLMEWEYQSVSLPFKKSHPLRQLSLRRVKIGDLQMAALAERCSALKELTILDCYHENEDVNESNKSKRWVQPILTLNLSSLRLDSLTIARLRDFEIDESRPTKTFVIEYPQTCNWYYFSHHATFVSYKDDNHFNHTQNNIHAIKYEVYPTSPKPPTQMYWEVPLELHRLHKNAVRQPFGRDPPCGGLVAISCKAVQKLHLENRRVQ
ncbi:hypothetical protein BC940DRAFT_337292 [Gongronella butleri]|nr:hypothetical protein BC940DRAFT_337292 [Gongronella butleri]